MEGCEFFKYIFMKEKIIVSLTTWSKRIGNLPVVLDTIFNQSMQPDLIVLNLAFNEIIPNDIQLYINAHNIEINRVPDTKVYKKIIPTLKKYPNDCIISIDDDWLYPEGMIADLIKMHTLYPNYPISGNDVVLFGLQCHCGCSSLTKADFFGDYLNQIDDEIINKCPSSDIVYTFFSSLSGHPYIRTEGQYFSNMQPYGQDEGYSEKNQIMFESINQSFLYLTERFGTVPSPFFYYFDDKYWSKFCSDIMSKSIKSTIEQTEGKIYNTHTFQLGQFILKPYFWFRNKVLNRFL